MPTSRRAIACTHNALSEQDVPATLSRGASSDRYAVRRPKSANPFPSGAAPGWVLGTLIPKFVACPGQKTAEAGIQRFRPAKSRETRTTW